MDYKDYYKTLNVAKKATKEEIKRAYRKLARKYHPDVNKEVTAEAQFKEVTEAYEVLKDEGKRKEYDTIGKNWNGGQNVRPPPGWDNQSEQRFTRGSSDNRSDFFEFLFGGGGRGFSSENVSSFGQGYQERGQDIHAKISISLEDSYVGAKRTITLNRTVNDGSGNHYVQPQSLQVTIPKGIIEGQQVRLEGQGDGGIGGGVPGNLFMEIVFEQHPAFTVSKRDIFLALPVTPWEAALGATIAVPTLGGNVDLKLPANSQTGQKLRLKGRGLSSTTQTGHQYVILTIHIPAAETTEQKELYEQMAKLMPYNPRSAVEVEK